MTVQMNIKNVEAVELAHELAEMDGVSLTEAVTKALREAKAAREADREATIKAVLEIIEDSHWRFDPKLSSADIDAFLYDENGLPK